MVTNNAGMVRENAKQHRFELGTSVGLAVAEYRGMGALHIALSNHVPRPEL